MNFATIIQKNWRGYNSRRVYVAPSDEKDVSTPERPSPKPLVSAAPASSTAVPLPSREATYSEDWMSQENTTLPRRLSSQLPFNRLYNVDIHIDGVVGLPITSTATRLKVRMMMPTRDVVGETPYEYCDLASSHTAPSFKLKHKWKAKSLHPTITVVCQVETLESLSLLPRVVGVAVLRLCVDNVGLQPISEVILDDRPSCYFNSGQFSVPLLYGVITDDFQFITEAKVQERLPHINGAFVRLSLIASKPGDHIVDQPFPADLQPEASVVASVRVPLGEQGSHADLISFTSTSVASTLLRTHIAISHLLQSKGSTGSQPASGSGFRVFMRPSSAGFGRSSPLVGGRPSTASYARPSTASGGVLGSGVHSPSSASAGNAFNTLKLSVPSMVITRFQQGESILDGECDTLLSDLQQYVLRSFDPAHGHNSNGSHGGTPEVSIHTALLHGIAMHGHTGASKGQSSQPPLLINPSYLSTFAHQPGALVGLDMLHNMPERKELIEAAEEAVALAAAESGLEKEWEDRIICFKTVFRYLPGLVFDGEGDYEQQVARSLREQSEQEKARNTSFRSTGPMPEGQQVIIDDASVKPYLPSTELNPGYLDDYSSTAGLRLGPFACALVVVTAVDVLTRTPPLEESADEEAQMLQIHGPDGSGSVDDGEPSGRLGQEAHDIGSGGGTSGVGGVSGKSLGSLAHSEQHASTARSKRLRGLWGVYVGHGDPRATWWGIVPLFRTLPSHVLASLPSKYSPHFKAGVGLQTIQGSPLHSGSHSPKSFGRASSLLGPLLSPKTASRPSAPPPSPNSTSGTPTTPMQGRSQAPNFGQIPTVDEHAPGEQTSSLSLTASERRRALSSAADTTTTSSSPSPTSRGGGRFRRGGDAEGGGGSSNNKASPSLTIEASLSASLSVSGLAQNPQSLLSSLAQVASWPLFVNQGNHQIPLFEGLPPEELILSPDPMLWLLRQLDKQQSAQAYLASNASSFASSSASLQRAASSSLSFLLSPLASFFGATASPSTRRRPTKRKKRKHSKRTEELSVTLSPGASVLVRLANPRMRKLAPLPIIDSRDKLVSKALLDSLLTLFSRQAGRPAGSAGGTGSAIARGATGQLLDSDEDAPALINPDLRRLLQDVSVDGAKMKMLRQQFHFVNAVNLFSSSGMPAPPFHHGLGGSMIYTGSPAMTMSGRPSTAQFRSSVNKRTLESLMSGKGLNPHDLVVLINHKFYETLST